MKALKKLKIILACPARIKAFARTVSGVALTVALGLPHAASAAQVLIDTSKGPIHIELLDQPFPAGAPQAVLNFLGYVDRGAYDRTIIHRSIANFVVQGGGYTFPQSASHIATDPSVVNEFSATRSNLRGTVAMAKVGPQYDASGNLVPGTGPDSATSEWFFNLADNSGPPAYLDTQNDGFTVFGRVLDTGMDVVDDIADLPLFPPARYPGFSELPNLNNSFVYVFRACRSDDLDGACTVDENQAAGEDGNGDGTPDRVQDNVASVLNAKLNNASMTYAADPGIRFETTSAGSANAQPLLNSFTYSATDTIVKFDQGVHAIAMTGTDSGETVTIFDNRPSARPNKYYVYDPSTGSWSDFSFDGTTGAELTFANRIVLHFVDNDRGDSDPAAGKIRHIGAPAIETPRPAAPTVKTIVLMQVPTLGAFHIGLYDDYAPGTVANFLGYVDRGDYDGGAYGATVIHFMADAFLRGGLYPGLTPLATRLPNVDQGKPPIPNESDPSRPNKRGTISMWWKTDGDPGSATSEWFINLKNNLGLVEDNLGFDSEAPGQGRAVFGEIVDGMEVVDRIAALPAYTLPDGNLRPPLTNPNSGGFPTNADYAYVRACRNNDLDGACTKEEDLAPNNGDGNGDGPLDSEQAHVASIFNPVLNRTVTAVGCSTTTVGCSTTVLFNTAQVADSAGSAALFNTASFAPPPGVITSISEGVYQFVMSNVSPAPTGEPVTILNRGAPPPSRYYAYDFASKTWYDFSFNGTTGAEILGDRIVLHFVDGGRGDNDPAPGKVQHTGAPATESPLAAADDNKNDWGCAIGIAPRRMSSAADWLVVLAFLAFAYRRTRGARYSTSTL